MYFFMSNEHYNDHTVYLFLSSVLQILHIVIPECICLLGGQGTSPAYQSLFVVLEQQNATDALAVNASPWKSREAFHRLPSKRCIKQCHLTAFS